ncbi:MAG: type II secretion system protein GspK [Betaproteobacteria bacterium]
MNPRLPASALAAPLAQRGIALVLVLWLTVLLTVIAGGFAYAMRNEAQAARNTMSQSQARALADGAVVRTVFELMRPRTIPGVWAADGLVHAWDEDGMRVAASAVDESGKIDLNAVADALLKGLLQTAGQLDADTAGRLVDVIGDWKDADDLRRPNGAEAAEYQAAGLAYKPANAAFETVADLQRVLGMTPALFARLAGSLTVYSGAPGINPQFASRTVLMALPGATDAIVDTFLAQRAAALAAGQPLPVLPLAGAGAPVNVWRVRAEVTAPDGVLFVREAVLRPNPDPRRPLTVLAWQEGERTQLAAAEAVNAPNANASR